MLLHAARQPILDRNLEVYAYELLFRDGLDDLFPDVDGDAATSQIVAASQFEFSLPELSAGYPAHINFNLKSLLKQYPTMIPSDQVVIEIVDIETPGKRLLEECKKLKEAGYQLLLDNYVHQKLWLHFMPYICMIKVDMLSVSQRDLQLLVKLKEKFNHIQVIASRIETQAHYQMASKLGFDYFQGYFFARTQQIAEKSVDVADFSLAELMFEISMSEVDVEKVVGIFQLDASLSYKLIRYANSAIFKRQVEIESIKQAVVSLGKEELLKFVSILFAAQSAANKPAELLSMSLMRAKLSEQLAREYGGRELVDAAFLTGMFSLIDVMLEEDMPSLVEKLKLSEQITLALIDGQGELARFIDLAKSYEEGDWELQEQCAETLNMSFDSIAKCYRESIQWTQEQMSFMTG